MKIGKLRDKLDELHEELYECKVPDEIAPHLGVMMLAMDDLLEAKAPKRSLDQIEDVARRAAFGFGFASGAFWRWWDKESDPKSRAKIGPILLEAGAYIGASPHQDVENVKDNAMKPFVLRWRTMLQVLKDRHPDGFPSGGSPKGKPGRLRLVK